LAALAPLTRLRSVALGSCAPVTAGGQLLVVDLPFLASRALAGAQIVTALETPDDHAPAPAVSGSKVSVTAARAVMSLRIAVAD
jgi:hypothetical protein